MVVAMPYHDRETQPVPHGKNPSRIERLLRLLLLVQHEPGLTSAQIQDRLGVSRRTFYRDLDALSEAGLAIHHSEQGGYRFDDHFDLPCPELSDDERVGLLLVSRLADGINNQPFMRSASSALGKILAHLSVDQQGTSVESLAHLTDFITVAPRDVGYVEQDAARFLDFCRAIRCGAMCRVAYRVAGKQITERHDFEPYHLYFKHRCWYVVGRSRQHDALRMFKLTRIERLVVDESDRFARPVDFNLQRDYLRHAWAFIPDGDPVRVSLLFSPLVADNVAEVQWHESQQQERLSDGRLRLEFNVAGTNEIAWWVMGYGDQVVVLEPEELRDRICTMAQAVVDRYGGGSADRRSVDDSVDTDAGETGHTDVVVRENLTVDDLKTRDVSRHGTEGEHL